MEHFPYQDGLLIWYWDTSYSDNDVGHHPGEGEILPIDAHPRPIARLDGLFWRGRIALYDATFGLQRADSFTLHVNSQPSYIRGQDAVPVFDDRRSYWDERTPTTGVKVPNAGVRIRRPRGDRDVGADPDHINGGRWLSPLRRAGWEDVLPARSAVQEPSKAQSRRTTVTSTRRQAMARSGLSLLAVLLLALGAGCGNDSSGTRDQARPVQRPDRARRRRRRRRRRDRRSAASRRRRWRRRRSRRPTRLTRSSR